MEAQIMAASKQSARRNPKVKPKSKATAPSRKRNPAPDKGKPAAPVDDSMDRLRAACDLRDSTPRPVEYPKNMPEIAAHVLDRYMNDEHKQRRALQWFMEAELQEHGILAVVEAYGRYFGREGTVCRIGDCYPEQETFSIEATQRGEYSGYGEAPDGFGEHTGRDATVGDIIRDIEENVGKDIEATRRLAYRAVDTELKFGSPNNLSNFIAYACEGLVGEGPDSAKGLAFVYEDLRRRAGLPMHWPQPIPKKEPAGSEAPAAGKAVTR